MARPAARLAGAQGRLAEAGSPESRRPAGACPPRAPGWRPAALPNSCRPARALLAAARLAPPATPRWPSATPCTAAQPWAQAGALCCQICRGEVCRHRALACCGPATGLSPKCMRSGSSGVASGAGRNAELGGCTPVASVRMAAGVLAGPALPCCTRTLPSALVQHGRVVTQTAAQDAAEAHVPCNRLACPSGDRTGQIAPSAVPGPAAGHHLHGKLQQRLVLQWRRRTMGVFW